LAGNGLVEAAGQLGIENVQIVEADGNTIIAVRRTGLTAKQKKRLALFDNRSAEHAEWNPEALAELVAEDFDFKDLFSPDELDAILAELMEPDGGLLATADPDAIPENVETRCKPGDLWQLGRHRLLCGDSTNPIDVERLMGGVSPAMVWADPPYGMQFQSNFRTATPKFERLQGDHAPLVEFMPLCVKTPVWYVCCRWDVASDFINAVKGCGFSVVNWIVWHKSRGSMGDLGASYRPTHETILYCSDGRVPFKSEGRDDDTWDEATDAPSKYTHPTQKPVSLVVRAMRSHTVVDDIVYDPFLGSGTSLIAAEQENRVCYGLEIEPKYCDVILTRWENATGKTATLITE